MTGTSGDLNTPSCVTRHSQETFIATAGQTVFTLTGVSIDEVLFARNGAVLAYAAVTTGANGQTITYVPAQNDGEVMAANDRVDIYYNWLECDGQITAGSPPATAPSSIWTDAAYGIAKIATPVEAAQDFDLGAGNLESIAAPVTVAGLNNLCGLTPQRAWDFVTKNFVIMTNRTFNVGVDARWPTIASVYQYLAHRTIAGGALVTIQLPAGITDASVTGLGPLHPQPAQIRLLGTVGTALPSEAALVCTGYGSAARLADAAINRPLLLAALPSIVILPSGTNTIWNIGAQGHGIARNVTFRTGATGGLAVIGSQDNANTSFRSVFIDGGNMVVSNSGFNARDVYSIGDPAQIASLRIDNGAVLEIINMCYLAGSAECGLHASTGARITSQSGVLATPAVLRAEGCEIHNICLHSGAALDTHSMRVTTRFAGEDNIEVGSGSVIHLVDDEGVLNSVNCSSPNGAGFGAGNILVEGGSKIVTDLQGKQIELNLDGGEYGIRADAGSFIQLLSGNMTNHNSSHFIAYGSRMWLHDSTISGGITCDATPQYTVYAGDGAYVETNGMVMPDSSVPSIGSPNMTTFTLVK
jgi:hypothetical protein